jgi:hypothetical protein
MSRKDLRVVGAVTRPLSWDDDDHDWRDDSSSSSDDDECD